MRTIGSAASQVKQEIRLSGAADMFVVEDELHAEPQGQFASFQQAIDELGAAVEYDYVVVNDDMTAALERLRSIVLAERARLGSMRQEAETIVRTFHD